MTFELNSTIQTADTDAVIAVLESQLKSRARSVVRANDSITAKKLDATWGSVQRNDVTTFEVRTNGRQSLVVAHVQYKPSAYFWICELFLMFTMLGWIFPLLYYFYQKKTVRKAIDEVLLRVKGECEFRGTEPRMVPSSPQPYSPPSQSLDTIHSLPVSSDAPVEGNSGSDTAVPAFLNKNDAPIQPPAYQPLPTARAEQPIGRSSPALLIALGFLSAIALVSTLGWLRTSHISPTVEAAPMPVATPAKEEHAAAPVPPDRAPEVPYTLASQPSTTVEQSPQPTASTSETSAVASSNTPVAQIKSVLDVWVQSMRSGDLNAQMTCYAPMLERYFRSTNVDEPTLRKSKAAWMAKWTSATFDLSEITFHELGSDRFEVEFHKEWDATGSSHFTGASRNVLIFQRIDDAWKIISEQEPQVYRVSNVPNQIPQANGYSDPLTEFNSLTAKASRPAGSEEVAYQIGSDVSAPVLVSKIEPEYSEEARKAKHSGSVLLSLEVNAEGLPRNVQVVRPLGLGLDEKAIDAVMKWRFRPGMKSGRAVATQAQVEVSFRLL